MVERVLLDQEVRGSTPTPGRGIFFVDGELLVERTFRLQGRKGVGILIVPADEAWAHTDWNRFLFALFT